MVKNQNPNIWWLIRILGTVLSLWLVVRSLDTGALFGQLQSIPVWGLVPLFGLYLLNQALTGWRWKILLDVVEISEPLWNLTVAVLYGQTINKILPSSIGGDTARVGYLFQSYPSQKTAALSATLMDRFLAFLGLMILGFLSLPFGTALSVNQQWTAGLALILFFGLLTAVFQGLFDSWIQSVLEWKLLPGKIQHYLFRFWDVFRSYRTKKQPLLGALAVSVLRQGLMILNLFFLFRLLEVGVTLGELFLVIPVVSLLVVLPISIGGIGVREAAQASLLGISSADVLSFTLIRYGFTALLPLILLLDSVLSAARTKSTG